MKCFFYIVLKLMFVVYGCCVEFIYLNVEFVSMYWERLEDVKKGFNLFMRCNSVILLVSFEFIKKFCINSFEEYVVFILVVLFSCLFLEVFM